MREALRRIAKDESGMTMGLAIMAVMIIGVMGAGLLTFVATDLRAATEANKGQRAFEMADAGMRAAGLQLTYDAAPGHYDGGANDVQWSPGVPNNLLKGMTFNDLDGSATTKDSTTVTIEYLSSRKSFRVISDGRYEDARRRIEATFEKITTDGRTNGIRAYYTPGDLNIQSSTNDDAIKGVSFFSGRNIILENFDFADYGNNDASIKIQTGVADALGDWNTTDDPTPAYWNSAGRKRGSTNSAPITDAGFAAEGYICKSADCPAPSPDPNAVATPTGEMISDGVYGYDRRTGTSGAKYKFHAKDPPDRNPNGTSSGASSRDIITYPFSRDRPNVEALLEKARSGGVNAYVDAATPPNFDDIYDSDAQRVVFIDANGRDVRLPIGSKKPKGILVVRCGNLTIEGGEFTGIVLVLDDDENTSRQCGAGDGKSKYRAENADVRGYVYAESTTRDDALYVDPGSRISPLPSGQGYEELLDLAWSSGSIRLKSWREVYR